MVKCLAASYANRFVQTPVGCCRTKLVRNLFVYVFVTVSLAQGPASVRSWFPRVQEYAFVPEASTMFVSLFSQSYFNVTLGTVG